MRIDGWAIKPGWQNASNAFKKYLPATPKVEVNKR
jgi:hypothetical protein